MVIIISYRKGWIYKDCCSGVAKSQFSINGSEKNLLINWLSNDN